MTEAIITFFRELTGNDYLTLFIISILPIVELRGGIIFMGGMDVNMFVGMLCCVAGSSLMTLPLIVAIRPLVSRMRNSKTFGRLGIALEECLTDRASDVDKGVGKWVGISTDAKKFLGVMLFVAVPLPMTGSWTGSAVASILDFKVWKAVLAVFVGNIIAGGILTAMVAFVPYEHIDFVLYGFIILATAIFLSMCWARIRKRKGNRGERC